MLIPHPLQGHFTASVSVYRLVESKWLNLKKCFATGFLRAMMSDSTLMFRDTDFKQSASFSNVANSTRASLTGNHSSDLKCLPSKRMIEGLCFVFGDNVQ